MIDLGAEYGLEALLVPSMHGWETIVFWRARYFDAKFTKAWWYLLMLPLLIEILRYCRAVASSIYPLCNIMLVVVSSHGQGAPERVRPSQINAVHMLTNKVTSRAVVATEMTSLRLIMSSKPGRARMANKKSLCPCCWHVPCKEAQSSVLRYTPRSKSCILRFDSPLEHCSWPIWLVHNVSKPHKAIFVIIPVHSISGQSEVQALQTNESLLHQQVVIAVPAIQAQSANAQRSSHFIRVLQ